MKERNYKYVAIAYMKLRALRKSVDALSLILLGLGSYPKDYACFIEPIYHALNSLEEKLEFKYK